MQFVNITKIIEKQMSKCSLFRKLILSYYSKIVKNEVELCDAQENSNVLCIGGGYFPCTAILFNKFSNASVTVVDNDINAIKSSTKLIKKLGLDNKIHVQFTDGSDVFAEDFDIINLAMQVSPKKAVFDNITQNMKKNSKLLVRTPKKHLKNGYCDFNDFESVSKYVSQPGFSNIERTHLYVR